MSQDMRNQMIDVTSTQVSKMLGDFRVQQSDCARYINDEKISASDLLKVLRLKSPFFFVLDWRSDKSEELQAVSEKIGIDMLWRKGRINGVPFDYELREYKHNHLNDGDSFAVHTVVCWQLFDTVFLDHDWLKSGARKSSTRRQAVTKQQFSLLDSVPIKSDPSDLPTRAELNELEMQDCRFILSYPEKILSHPSGLPRFAGGTLPGSKRVVIEVREDGHWKRVLLPTGIASWVELPESQILNVTMFSKKPS